MFQEDIVTPIVQDSNPTTNSVPLNSVIDIPNPVPDPTTPNRLCPAPSESANFSPVGSTNLNVNYPVQIPEQDNLDSKLKDNSD